MTSTPPVCERPGVGPIRFGRLVGVELNRLTARRFFRWVLMMGLIAFLITVGVAWHGHSRVTASDRAQATQQRDQQVQQYRQQMIRCQSTLLDGQSPDQCGSVPTPDEFPIDQFLRNHPFTADLVMKYAEGLGIASALLGFVFGASFIGAEWSTKNLVALLYWEPRRFRVMASKLIALVTVMLVVAVAIELSWYFIAHLLIQYRGLAPPGSADQRSHFWSRLASMEARAGLLGLATALVGFGLANLIRNTAAALGVAFIYFAVIESLIRAIDRNLQPYLITTNVRAWLSRAGVTLYGNSGFNPSEGQVTPRVIHISLAAGGVALLLLACVVTALSLTTFRVRDIS